MSSTKTRQVTARQPRKSTARTAPSTKAKPARARTAARTANSETSHRSGAPARSAAPSRSAGPSRPGNNLVRTLGVRLGRAWHLLSRWLRTPLGHWVTKKIGDEVTALCLRAAVGVVIAAL